MFIVLAKMVQSPYNRSIWSGFSSAFSRLGCRVLEVDAEKVPGPANHNARPDLLFAVHGGNLPVDKIDEYHEAGIPTAVYLLDEPYEVDASRIWSRHYDRVFSVDRATVPVHAEHARAFFLPLAYNDQVFNPDGPSIDSDILVLGSPFAARHAFLTAVYARWGGRITWVGPGWRAYYAAGRHIDRLVSPEECASLYRGAKIVVNIHRDPTWSHGNVPWIEEDSTNKAGIRATHLNPRFWEAAGCGSLQLCSDREDIRRFAPRCPVFRTPEELETKLDYFLNTRQARLKLSQQVYRKVRRHTYLERAKTVLECATQE